MERHSLKALISIALLVPLSWVGIALIDRLHAGGAMTGLVVIWAVVVVAVAAIAISSLVHARHARLERRPEGTHSR